MAPTSTSSGCESEHNEPRSIAELLAPSSQCAWQGCTAHFLGNMPSGWTYLLTCWSRQSRKQILDVSSNDTLRNGFLCPEHVHVLEQQLGMMDETRPEIETTPTI